MFRRGNICYCCCFKLQLHPPSHEMIKHLSKGGKIQSHPCSIKMDSITSEHKWFCYFSIVFKDFCSHYKNDTSIKMEKIYNSQRKFENAEKYKENINHTKFFHSKTTSIILVHLLMGLFFFVFFKYSLYIFCVRSYFFHVTSHYLYPCH